MSDFIEMARRAGGAGPGAGLSSNAKIEIGLRQEGTPLPNPAAALHAKAEAARAKAKFEAYRGDGSVDPNDPGKRFKLVHPRPGFDGESAGLIFRDGIGYSDYRAQAVWLAKLGCHMVDRQPKTSVEAAKNPEPETWTPEAQKQDRPPRYQVTIPAGRRWAGESRTDSHGVQFEKGIAEVNDSIVALRYMNLAYDVLDRYPYEAK